MDEPKKQFAAAGVILKMGDGKVKEVLMIQRAKKDPLWPLQWEFPRGKCEVGVDKSLRDCMIREVKEETGLDVKVLKLIDKHKYTKVGENTVTICYNYACRMLDPDQEVRLSREHDSYKWISEVGEVQLMATPEQRKTIQKVLNNERAITSQPKRQKVEEIGPAGMALAGTALKSKTGKQLAKGVARGIQNRTMPRERNIKMGSFSYSSKPRYPQQTEESNLDFYLRALHEETLNEEPITLGMIGAGLVKVYIGAMLIKLAKDVFKLNFTKIGRQCKDYPGGERGICMLRAKMQAKKAEVEKLKSGISKCAKDKDPEACKRKVAGRIKTVEDEISYMSRRTGELRRAPIVH